MLSIRVGATFNGGSPTGGSWMHSLQSYGNLAFSTTLQRPDTSAGGGGLHVVSWDMTLPGNLPIPTDLRRDSLVELFADSYPLGAAVVTETPRGNTVTAKGVFRLGEDFLAVDGAGLPTTNIRTAVQRATADGLRWVDPEDLPNTSLSTLSETSAKFNTISALLNAYCKANNKLWYIDRYHVLRIIDQPDTTLEDWSLSPLVPNPQRAADDFVSRWFIRRTDGVDGDGQPNAWGSNDAIDPDAPATHEEAADLESMGYMNSAAGDAMAEAYLEANKSRASFAEGVEVTHGLITTPGGTPPELWAVCAGDVTRQPTWLTASGDLVLGDAQAWVIGGTQWRDGQPLTITPMNLAARTAAQVTQRQGGRASKLVFS